MARIYQTRDMGMADIRAALVDHPGEADLCVRRVGSWGLADGDARWYICTNRQDAQVCVWFGSRGMAEVKICFVSDYTQAGWKTAHRLRGRFSR
ncbi:MAG: hypothetical protein KDI42_00315 [Gammaproteobacteria bacterium]|nr:hypothetical protein [Gammaproteobacteria bacterium]